MLAAPRTDERWRIVRRKALSGVGAASLAVMATLAGAPAAGAQEVCITCPTDPGGGSTAFHKITELGMPGATEGVFLKQASVAPAFYKLGDLGFPGASEDVFGKH